MTARKDPEKKSTVYVWCAPEGSGCKYSTMTAAGELLRHWKSLKDISAWYRLTDSRGSVQLVRQLDKIWAAPAWLQEAKEGKRVFDPERKEGKA